MMKEINFDMDGTIANFYGVEGWLADLESESVRPYAIAKPLVNMRVLARYIHKLQRNGYRVNIISWLSKTGSEEYNEKVTQVKKVWLKKHLPSVEFDSITIVKYGTPKSSCGVGVLFDDEERNRNEWKGVAYDVENILGVLKSFA